MTVYVKENTEDMAEALSYMETAMIEDYNHFTNMDTEVARKMRLEFATGIEVSYGKKYIKIITGKKVEIGVFGVLSSIPILTRSSRRAIF